MLLLSQAQTSSHLYFRSQVAQVLLSLSLVIAPATHSAPKATWDGHASAEAACLTLYGKDGAYVFHRVEIRDEIAYCYEKIKDGEEKEIKFGSVSRDEAAEEAKEEPSAGSHTMPSDTAPSKSPDGDSASGKDKDEFLAKCISFSSNDWTSELDAAYKAPVSGSGGAGSGMFEAQNAAVLEWRESGIRKTEWFTSGDGHTEKHILKYLKDKNIPMKNVTRIYTVLSPCLSQCLPALSKHFRGMRKNVTIEFSWFHGTGMEYQDCSHKNATQDRKAQKKARRDRVSAGG